MRIIDKTPFLEKDGSINIVNRIKGTLQNGFSWYGNLQAQERALKYFNKQFDKKFTLIRNLTLGASEITIPLILIGTPGIYVFTVTNLEGTYRAKGNSWAKLDGENYKEASINLVKRSLLYTKAVDVYLEKQNIQLPESSTGILLAPNAGMYIETVQPAVRIVMADALDRFSTQIRQAPPIMTHEDVHRIADVLLNPTRKKKTAPEDSFHDFDAENPSTANDNNPDDLGFSFNDGTETEAELPPAPVADKAPAPRPAAKKRRKAPQRGLFGMTNKQLLILAAMAAFVALMLIVITIVALLSL